MQRVRSFWYGLTLPLTAFRLIIAHSGLVLWSILPIAVTLTLYFLLISALQTAAREQLHAYFLSWGWSPEGWAAWGLLVLTRIVLILVGALTFTFVASVTASPFNDFLAEATEKWARPALPPVTRASLLHKIRLIAIDLLKTVAATAATIIALLLSWVPVVNLFAFGVAFLLVTFQFISYPQTRRGLGVRDGAAFLWRHLYACAGFGAVLSVLFAIPIVASLCLPLAVVGGTLLVARAPGDPAEKLFRLR